MRWTEEQLAEHLGQRRMMPQQTPALMKAKRSKFKNIRCQAKDGTNFASKLERDYYEDLLLRWKAGDCLWFIRQPRFDLEGGVKYVGDFLVVEQLASGQNVRVVDTKGVQTAAFRDKRKQMRARYGIEIEVVTK